MYKYVVFSASSALLFLTAFAHADVNCPYDGKKSKFLIAGFKQPLSCTAAGGGRTSTKGRSFEHGKVVEEHNSHGCTWTRSLKRGIGIKLNINEK